MTTRFANNDSLHSFNTVTADVALKRAKAADAGLASGAGVVPETKAHSVQLQLDAGAVLLGKCPTIEFATGGPTRERLMAGASVRGSDYVEAQRLRRALTIVVNNPALGGYDALIAPCSIVPVGRFDALPNDPMQIVGKAFEEAPPFRVGAAYEKATDRRSRRPGLIQNVLMEAAD